MRVFCSDGPVEGRLGIQELFVDICRMAFRFFDPGVGEFVMYASFLYGGPVEGRLYMYISYSLLFLVQGGPVEGRLQLRNCLFGYMCRMVISNFDTC